MAVPISPGLVVGLKVVNQIAVPVQSSLSSHRKSTPQLAIKRKYTFQLLSK